MRPETKKLLSEYSAGRIGLDSVRQWIEDVDWDAPSLPEDERALLLGIEARLAGLDEGLNEEVEMREFIVSSIPLQLTVPNVVEKLDQLSKKGRVTRLMAA